MCERPVLCGVNVPGGYGGDFSPIGDVELAARSVADGYDGSVASQTDRVPLTCCESGLHDLQA